MPNVKHSWALLRARAIALGLSIVAYGQKSSGVLREERAALVDEAKACEDRAEANGGEFNDKDLARHIEIFGEDGEGGLCAALTDKIAETINAENRRKASALARKHGKELVDPFANSYHPGGSDSGKEKKPRFSFRNQQTGQVVHALRADEPISPAAYDNGFDGATIHTPGDPSSVSGHGAYNGPRLGDVLNTLVTGRAMPDGHSVQAALGGTDSGGGYLLEPQVGSLVIDLARSASVALKAGVQTIPMDTAELTLARVTGDATGHWRPEAVNVPSSDVQFGRINLRAKTLAAVVPISVELLEDASNAGALIEGTIRRQLALMLDQAILRGNGAESQPLGIVNTGGVNSVASVGTPADYSEVSEGIGQIFDADFDGEPSDLSWVSNPRELRTYDGLVDTTGQPLKPTPWAEAVKSYSTTSMPTTLGGGAESEMIVGDFSQVLVGLRTNGIRVRILESGNFTDSAGATHEAATSLQKLIVCYLRADVATMRPEWLSVLSGVTAA